MAVKFDVTEGGFVQDPSVKPVIEFRIKGDIENPVLNATTAPAYTSRGFAIASARLSITSGLVGVFKIELRSSNSDGTGEVTHISGNVTISSPGPQGVALTVAVPTIGTSKVIKLYTQYISGSVSSDITVTLE